MRIATYIKKNHETLPPKLAQLLTEETSIWTNDACCGYCVAALESAGFQREEIIKIMVSLAQAFDVYSVEEAEQKWLNY